MEWRCRLCLLMLCHFIPCHIISPHHIQLYCHLWTFSFVSKVGSSMFSGRKYKYGNAFNVHNKQKTGEKSWETEILVHLIWTALKDALQYFMSCHVISIHFTSMQFNSCQLRCAYSMYVYARSLLATGRSEYANNRNRRIWRLHHSVFLLRRSEVGHAVIDAHHADGYERIEVLYYWWILSHWDLYCVNITTEYMKFP